MDELVLRWYELVSTLNRAVIGPVDALDRRINVPIISALLLGFIGATSPCQLSTNAGALAYIARGAGSRAVVVRHAGAYLLGKVLVYTVLGTAVLLAGRGVSQELIPVIVTARKVLGPFMVVLGLFLLGLLPLRFSVGHRLSGWLEARAGTGARGAFVLGVAFSFAFCPSLFLLFFAVTMPLALRSPVGVTFPGIFALGTTLPLLGLAAAVTAGMGAAKGYMRRAQRLNRWVRPLAAIVLIAAGLHDTFVYWFL